MKPRIFIVCILTLLLIPLNALAKNPITWTPKSITETMGLMDSDTVSVVLSSDEDLGQVDLWVVPELQPFITLDPSSFADVQAGVEYDVELTCTIPSGTETGLHDGTIHVRSGTETIPATLKVEIDILNNPNPGVPDLMEGAVLLPDDTPVEIATLEYETNEGIIPVEAAIGRVIVQFYLDVPTETAENLITSNGGNIIEKIPNVGFYVVMVSPDSEMIFAEIMRQYASVDFADIDFLLHATEYTSDPQEGVGNRLYLEQINAPASWEWINEELQNEATNLIIIGIIDSGFDNIDLNHIDFRSRAEYFPPEYIPPTPCSNHGTQVAAVAVATGNTNDQCTTVPSGICGNIGIDWTGQIRLSGPKKCQISGLFYSWVRKRLISLVAEGVEVINISGVPHWPPTGECNIGDRYFARLYFEDLARWIKQIGKKYPHTQFIVVNAAGNDNCDLGNIEKPENFIVVGGVRELASNPDEFERHPHSNYGLVIDIGAPYVVEEYYSYGRGVTEDMAGTSFSAPLVTGAAALVWSYDDNILFSADEVVQRLKKTAQGEIPDFDDAGVLNIYEAQDKCPGTPSDELPNQYGCSISQLVVDLELPADQAIIPTEQYTFKWKPLSHINESSFRYFISVKEDAEPEDIIFLEDFVGNNKEVTLFGFEPGKKYLWHVWAVDQQDHWSIARDAGDWWSFTTACADNDGDTYDTCEPGEPGDDGKPKDCDDTDADIYPGAEELCDGIDNNCDGAIDEGLPIVTYYRDADYDGYGDPNDSITDCRGYLGYITVSGDCDDTDASINPDATEICGDGIDQNCNNQVDEGCGPATYSEDFEDGYLDSPWGVGGYYEITTVPGGSLGLNMTEGIDLGGGTISAEVGSYFDEYVYHFEADVYVPSTHSLILGIVLWWNEISNPSIGYRTDLKITPMDYGPIFQLNFGKDGVLIAQEDLGPANFDQWYKLSITYHDNYIRVGIDGNEKNFFCGSYQKPDSPVESYCSVHGHNPVIQDPVLGINYYVDNIKAHTAPLPLPVVPTPTGLTANYDEVDNWNWITWNDVPEAVSYNLYWGTESGVTQCSEFAGNTPNTEFSHTGVVPGSTYYYKVTSVDADGNESALSEEESAYVPGGLPTTITRVSVAADGTQTNGDSLHPTMNADGRFIAFISNASNLIPGGDTNGFQDSFVYDRLTGVTEQINVNSNGEEGEGHASVRVLSADGRYAGFTTNANNLVPNDTIGEDVFVRDRLSGTTERVSIASDGSQANSGSRGGYISTDGRVVAFYSGANNLVPDDTNSSSDIFVRDRLAGTTERVSIASDGSEGYDAKYTYIHQPFSANGEIVVFSTQMKNLVPEDTNNKMDVFTHNRLTGVTERISIAWDGTEADGSSNIPAVSADGRFVAFHSTASNLIIGDTNGVQDIFVRDLLNGITERVSVASGGTEANGDNLSPMISKDSRFVVFQSDADNLVPVDTNGTTDIFVHDRLTGTTERVSVAFDNSEADNYSTSAWISGDGKFISFHSVATNLVPNDTNEYGDIFVAPNPLF